MSRKRPKPGLLEMAMYASAIAELSGGSLLKNSITDTIRTGSSQAGLHFSGNKFGNAITMVLAGKILHTEMNKVGYNPALGPVRLL